MSEYIEVVPGTLKTSQLHQYLTASVAPRPIAFAGTIDKQGNRNLAPFSFFNVFSAKPPILIFSPARRVRDNTTKHTLHNVYEVPEVVINVVSYAMVEQMNLASCEYEEDVDEYIKAGFTPLASDLVAPFRVAEAPVQMECRVVEIKPLDSEGGAGQLVFAKVLKMHIKKEILDANDKIDPAKIDLVSRLGGNWYGRAQGDALFEVAKPGRVPGMGVDALPEPIRLSKILTGNDLGKLGMVTELPTPEEISAFQANERQGILKGVETVEEAHRAAQSLLDKGEVEMAWKVLLSSFSY